MILIKVFGERTDVAAYMSYYAKEEIKVITEDNDIFFETVVSGFFVDGDMVDVDNLFIFVQMDGKYDKLKKPIAEVLNHYGNFFTRNCFVKFDKITKDEDYFNFKNKNIKKFENEEVDIEGECHCHDHDCHCHEHEHEHHCDCGCEEDKCSCGPECTCGCQEGKECTCGCQEGKECTCGNNKKKKSKKQ